MAAKFVFFVLAAVAVAEASYYNSGYGRGIAYHPYGGSSYTYRSPQGLGKREAEPSYSYGGYGRAIAYHPYGGSSYTYRSPQGLGKREAEPSYSYGGYGRAIAYHPYGGSSYTYRSPQGLGKREAEPSYSYGGGYQSVRRYDGYGQSASYDVRTNGYSGSVNHGRDYGYGSYNYGFSNYHKREAEPSYSSGGGYQHVSRYDDGAHYSVRTSGYNGYINDGRRHGYHSRGYGYHKRAAEPGYGSYSYGGGYQHVNRYDDGARYSVRTSGYNGYIDDGRRHGYHSSRGYGYHKRAAEPSYGSYSYGGGYQHVNRYDDGARYSVRTSGYHGYIDDGRLHGSYGYH